MNCELDDLESEDVLEAVVSGCESESEDELLGDLFDRRSSSPLTGALRSSIIQPVG